MARGSIPDEHDPVVKKTKEKKTRRCRVKCCMSLEQIEQSLREAEERHAAALEAVEALPLESKIDELWGWAEGTRSGGCMGCRGERFVKHGEIEGMAEAAGMEFKALCELLGAEPVRGPRAVLGGRAGTVIEIMSATDERNEDGVEKIQVRWEDDGTESPGVYEDVAIKVSDLDEPLGEGSAVRCGGRRGTAETEPSYGGIKIRWEDDGTLSDEYI